MKIQTCDNLGVKTFTDTTNEKEILLMLNDIFNYEEAYRVIELSTEEETILEDYYRDYMLTNEDDMPSCIDGYLLDHDSNKWYMFRSNDMYNYSYTVEKHYQSTLNELNYIQLVMENIEKEAE
jgi:hypothetical protein